MNLFALLTYKSGWICRQYICASVHRGVPMWGSGYTYSMQVCIEVLYVRVAGHMDSVLAAHNSKNDWYVQT